MKSTAVTYVYGCNLGWRIPQSMANQLLTFQKRSLTLIFPEKPTINRFRTGQGRCNHLLHKWDFDPSCSCGHPEQTMTHISVHIQKIPRRFRCSSFLYIWPCFFVQFWFCCYQIGSDQTFIIFNLIRIGLISYKIINFFRNCITLK